MQIFFQTTGTIKYISDDYDETVTQHSLLHRLIGTVIPQSAWFWENMVAYDV